MALAPPPPTSTSIYDQYNPNGEAGGLFAPPHIAGWQPAQDATEKYYKRRFGVTGDMIDELRMPQAGAPASGSVNSGGSDTINFVPKAGYADPKLLKAAAQGGEYDVQGRRDAIAAQVMANNTPAPATAAAPQAAQQMPDWYTERSLRGW
jgi:hypothetical protein